MTFKSLWKLRVGFIVLRELRRTLKRVLGELDMATICAVVDNRFSFWIHNESATIGSMEYDTKKFWFKSILYTINEIKSLFILLKYIVKGCFYNFIKKNLKIY